MTTVLPRLVLFAIFVEVAIAQLFQRLRDDVEVFDPAGKALNRPQVQPPRLQPYRQFDILPHPELGWKVSSTLASENAEQAISGHVSFKQWDPVHVLVTINATGLPPGRHAVHIHAFGDLTQGCKSTGPHFRSNLIGNVDVKQDGTVFLQFYSPYIRLFDLTGIVGRSLVIHEKESNYDKYPSVYSPPAVQQFDDPGSYQRDEDAVGAILACGVITITDNVD